MIINCNIRIHVKDSLNFISKRFTDFILRQLRSHFQLRAQELLMRELNNRLITKANGRGLWTPLKPTIDYLTTVGISSGSVLEVDYDYKEETNEEFERTE